MGIISRIAVRDFRNLTSVDAQLSPGLNIVKGDNAQGKTSLLESIHYLSLLRSFRTRRPAEMIRWGAKAFSLRGDILPTGSSKSSLDKHTVGVRYADRRELKIDGRNVSSPAEFINSFLCVALVPEDLSLVKGGPLFRRRYLDMLLCQVSGDYLSGLVHYNRALANRNAMLRDSSKYGEKAVRAFDEILAKTGAFLTSARTRVVIRMNDLYRALAARLSGGKFDVKAEFVSSVFRRQTASATEPELEHGILSCLEKEYGRDQEKKTTRFGPHRDDIDLQFGGRSLAAYASEGQCRLASLALRLSCVQYIAETVSDHDIVLLVDDVFGELDGDRRTTFFAELRKAGQVVLACTSVPPELPETGKLLTMTAGQLTGG